MAKRGRPQEAYPQHRRIADALRMRIKNGEWPNGSIVPSMRVLGAEWKVSRHTIWLAMEVLRKENCILKSGRGRLIVRSAVSGAVLARGLILQLMGDNLAHRYHGYIRDLQTGILLGAGKLSAPILIAHDDRLRTQIPEDLLDLPLLGIVSLVAQKKSMIQRLAQLGHPVVLVDHPPVKQNLHSICVDNSGGMRHGLQALTEKGHRHIAFVRIANASTNDIDPDSSMRQRAFLKHGKEFDLKALKHSVFTLTSAHNPSSPTIKNILAASAPFTAVICADQGVALSLIQAAKDRGLRIPKDISFLAFGPVQTPSSIVTGPLTDYEEMGRKALAILQNPTASPKDQVVPYHWNPGKTMDLKRS